jgi:hypothetical protein
MELAPAIWTRSRVRPFSAAALILTLSVSGWAQQAPSTSQKHQAARSCTISSTILCTVRIDRALTTVYPLR